MLRRRVGHKTTSRVLFAVLLAGSVALSTPAANAVVQQLYVGNDNSPGSVLQYNLPVSASSTPNGGVASDNVVSVAIDPSGNMAVGNFSGGLTFFTAPLTAASVPSASFPNGGGSNAGQIAFTPAGDFFVSTAGAQGVNKFTAPFSNASTPSQSITAVGLTAPIGVALDAAQNLYISNSAGGGSNIYVYAPPYNGVPTITPAVPGTFYRKMAVNGTQLFVDDLSGATGKVEAYNIPITTASVLPCSITGGVNTPEGAALDAGGNLYIGNLANATVTVYTGPFSAGSTPTTTLTVNGGS